ncbi:MAG: hypothetical protein ACXVHU_09695, partial [Methanobacterium sp.]
YWLLFGNVIIAQQIAAGYMAPNASMVTNSIIEITVITFIIYLILGVIFGIIGVAVKKWRTSS